MVIVKGKWKGDYMKKYIINYAVIIVVLLVMALTHGIPFGIKISEIKELYGINPRINQSVVLIFNAIIMAGCIIRTIQITLQKENTVPLKWFIPVAVLVSFVFIPLFATKYILIPSMKVIYKFWSLFSWVMR